ncbi:hypothetical protein SAMN04488084_1137 [Pedobacter antarcticus]|nr:hypothetical protein SAMN04488084_1137 [Pedobacter antarcticus]
MTLRNIFLHGFCDSNENAVFSKKGPNYILKSTFLAKMEEIFRQKNEINLNLAEHMRQMIKKHISLPKNIKTNLNPETN